MQSLTMVRRGVVALVVVLAAAIAVAAGFAAAINAGLFHDVLVRLVALRADRPVQVQGAWKAHLFARNPSISAEGVIVGNPSWMPAGRAAEIGELSLTLQWPGSHRHFGIVGLSLHAAKLYLARDSDGRANWGLSEHGTSSRKSAIIRSLSVPAAHVLLDDERRHLRFDGTASVTATGNQPLRIEASGVLNGRDATLELDADPLSGASHDEPYHFSFTERSSGSQLEGRGTLPRPFDFTSVKMTFDAAGEDARDLYFLTGLKVLNTGRYRMSGQFVREGLRFNTEFSLTSGESDLKGSVSVDSTNVRPQLDVDFESQVLRLADLGAHASGRASAIEARGPFLLSDMSIDPAGLRRDDAKISFHAHRVMVGRIALTGVSAQATLSQGALTVQPLEGDVLRGKLDARLQFDARSNPPTAQADIRFVNLQLGELHRTDSAPPPIEGLLNLQAALSGKGTSLHQLAASANGTVAAVIPGGTIRESLAEIAGVDLRALGLLITMNTRDTVLRCAVALLDAHAGKLTAQRLVADTGPVLITGQGEVDFDTESLDLVIRGQPKHPRLFRFHSPLIVTGTLSHPSIDIKAHRLEILDRGQAKDVDCASLTAPANLNARQPR